MKKLVTAIALSALATIGFAHPTCPSIDDVKNTQMDFVLASDGSSPVFQEGYEAYATMGHMHGTDGNWYVADGIFEDFTSVSDALQRGQEFLVNAGEPTMYHDDEKTNVWACVYLADQAEMKFIVALNGSHEAVSSLGGFRKFIKNLH